MDDTSDTRTSSGFTPTHGAVLLIVTSALGLFVLGYLFR